MKKLFLSFISTLFLLSCSFTNEPEDLNIKETLRISDLDYVGKLHNQGLVHSFNEIKNLIEDGQRVSRGDKQSLIQIQKEISQEFVSNQKFDQNVIEISINQIEIGVGDFLIFNPNKARTSQSSSIPDSLLSEISVQGREMLFRIFEIMEDTDTDIESVTTKISNIEQKAISTLEINEQFMILSTASVAKHTLAYWNENYEEWLNLLGNSSKSRINGSGIDWKAAGYADVGGAALAGLGLAVSGTGAGMAAAGPAGWAGIGLVVAGRGLQASATRILLGFW